MRLSWLGLAAVIAVTPASGQWQVPDHSVPIGRGGGISGFKNAAPGTAGFGLVSNGATSDPSFQAITGTAFGTQSANTFFAGPTSGAAAMPAFRALIGTDLPNPSASTLGGVQSKAAITSQWLNSISTSGVPTSAQPAFTDISGTATATQGGTGLATFAVGDLLQANSTTTLARLASVATGNVLRSGGVGTISSWGKVNLSTDVSNTLQAAQFPALTGDVTTISGALATTLATVNSNVGSFGSTSSVPNFTVNAKGLITAAGAAAYQDGTNAAKGVVRGDGTTINCVAGVCTAVGAAATSIGVGTTTVSGGTSGDMLFINAGTLGSKPTISVVKIQTFCASGCTTTIAGGGSGTYTPATGTQYVQLACYGGGGGGGAAANAPAGGSGAGGGGGAGSKGLKIVPVATIGASKTVFIGAGGAPGSAASPFPGSAGGDSCFTTSSCTSGQIVAGKGASGGAGNGAVGAGGAGGVAGTGDAPLSPGQSGGSGIGSSIVTISVPFPFGGSTDVGAGGPQTVGNVSHSGDAGSGYGSGGAGGGSFAAGGAANGGSGAAGFCSATEYTSQ